MPPRRRRLDGLDILDDVVDNAIDSLFDRGAKFVQDIKKSQQAAAPHQVTVTRVCIWCKQPKQSELVNANAKQGEEGYGFGLCKSCLDFMWHAAQEKMRFLARENQRRQAGEAPRTAPVQPRRPPWETLGISADASEDDIKKAYRRVAALWHPDRVPPGSPDSEKAHARSMFEEAGRARDAMLSVRQVRT